MAAQTEITPAGNIRFGIIGALRILPQRLCFIVLQFGLDVINLAYE
jgi:hypothetical protein